LDSVDVVRSDAPVLECSSRVDIDSSDLRLRFELLSTKGSGVVSSQASSRVSKPLLGGVAGATGSGGGDVMFWSLVLGDDPRCRRRPVELGILGDSSADTLPWLRGRRLLRLSRISSSRGDVTLLSSYSTVTMLAVSSTSDVSDLLAGREVCLNAAPSSAESEPRGDVRARGLRRTLTTSTGSWGGLGDVGATPSSSLLTSPALPEPLLAGRSFSELLGFEGLRCFWGPFF
jgi:hypothetical protein